MCRATCDGELCEAQRICEKTAEVTGCKDCKGMYGCQHEKVLCSIVEIVLEGARLHGTGPRELSKALHEASGEPKAYSCKLPYPTFLSVLIINPYLYIYIYNRDLRPTSRFW